MNDIQFASSIRQSLDESAQRLPWRITHRLERARKSALAQVTDRKADPAEAIDRVIIPVTGRERFTHGGSMPPAWELAEQTQAPLGWRLAAIVLPAAVLVGGLIGFSELESTRSATEIANLETAVLTDDVPIAAYADRGFGVFLKNSEQ